MPWEDSSEPTSQADHVCGLSEHIGFENGKKKKLFTLFLTDAIKYRCTCPYSISHYFFSLCVAIKQRAALAMSKKKIINK